MTSYIFFLNCIYKLAEMMTGILLLYVNCILLGSEPKDVFFFKFQYAVLTDFERLIEPDCL